MTQKQMQKMTEEWLNERWIFAISEDARPQDISYYHGALTALEFIGYNWIRDIEGKHTLIKKVIKGD